MLRSGTGIWERGVMGKHGEIAGPGVGYPIPRPIYHGIYHQCVFLIRMHARKQNGELSSGRRRRSSDRRFVRRYFVHTGCTALQPSCHEECWTHSCSKGRHGMRKKPISDRHKDRQAGTGGFLA